VLCAGPIGNLGDAPPRLAETLAAASIVYAEDTRRARTLLQHLGVDRPVRSYFVGNEAERASELAQRLESGETVALITDAGMPSIADPGLSAVRVAIETGAEVSAVPGPSAVTMAVAVSGLPADRFVFEGFLPRKGRERRDRLELLASETRTTVLFCAPRRLVADLADLREACGDRAVAVCREMTKLHEEVWRGSLGDAIDEWGGREVRGEVTVVLGGAAATEPDLEAAVELVREEVAAGATQSAAVKSVAARTGVRRRALYEAVLREL
jgi:16S rRNA (cytidine1402-2'-O)-methyltransferase